MRTEALTDWVCGLFATAGIPSEAARRVSTSLVVADLEGVPSHGVMLMPMYIDRLLAGSVSKKTNAETVHDSGAAVILDAGNMLGQLSSEQAIALVAERARKY